MAKTSAERQREYRDRAFKDPFGLNLTRVQVMLDAHPAANLRRMAKYTGKSKRELIEQAINELAAKLNCNYGD
ncbi:ribbon-helix-helix protein, CopG family [Nitrosomonas sp. Nm34]|jgi:hypothetical protein|uniref:ribbon-helix-helix protein, CopG family n=1 Tax=Nitrosomonas sp. Nm34 TaxID=1881055 RepID=UPI0008E2BF62|nr:ribbon-helix-helix protein, CopG family [Nitrosomonas sp. Nm34]SFJ05140.1 Ribbon-helix-helix protein, copG family [Nitrosomonas sp. Nm34]